jgi:hypothetical protein
MATILPRYSASFIVTVKRGREPVHHHVTGHAKSEADFLNFIFNKWGVGSWDFHVTSCECIS